MKSLAIQTVIRAGKRLETPYARLYILPTPQTSRAVACIVGKKVHRKAHIRHRYQRLLREAARLTLPPEARYAMVMLGKPEILSIKKLSELVASLKPYFDQL